uniref:Uncharacterized protein n=1 Tax=viral metagenome TaxID=1070528 RepID=A0A6C0ECX2_9ZZZZ
MNILGVKDRETLSTIELYTFDDGVKYLTHINNNNNIGWPRFVSFEFEISGAPINLKRPSIFVFYSCVYFQTENNYLGPFLHKLEKKYRRQNNDKNFTINNVINFDTTSESGVNEKYLQEKDIDPKNIICFSYQYQRPINVSINNIKLTCTSDVLDILFKSTNLEYYKYIITTEMDFINCDTLRKFQRHVGKNKGVPRVKSEYCPYMMITSINISFDLEKIKNTCKKYAQHNVKVYSNLMFINNKLELPSEIWDYIAEIVSYYEQIKFIEKLNKSANDIF